MRRAPEYEENARLRYDDLANITSKISETSRFVGFGLLAIFYTIRTSADTFTSKLFQDNTTLVYLIGGAGLISILCDYLQFFFAERAANQALKTADAKYPPRSALYFLWHVFFYLKQAFGFIGAVLLVLLFWWSR